MKKLNLLFAIFAIALVGMMSSCDTTTDPSDETPLLTITTSGLTSSNTIDEGLTYDISIVAAENPTSGKKLDDLEIQTPGADTTIVINASSYSQTFTVPAPLDGVSSTFTFILTDKAGVSTTETLTVTGTSSVTGTPFSAEVVGAFFHISGTAHGAYNLMDEVTVAASGSEMMKDMKNTDAAGANFSGSWTAGTGNGSLFVRDAAYDYDNGTVEDATAAFAAGSSQGTILNPLAGDIFIVKLRGGSDYAVIEIVSVDPTDTTGGVNNPGKITFNFKKS